MKNRFSKMGKSLLGAMCLLSTCGITYSCSDDYDLDETMPSFLGGSIYDELKSGRSGNFSTVVRLIDDLKYTDVLSKTGSKTLFVADDDAYKKFFENNSWGVTKYEDLSTAQKSILLYGSMLNNADVLEMLPYSNGGGSLTMRRSTALTALDSVKLWDWKELPENLNLDAEADDTKDHKFWERYRNQAHGSMLMALDASSPMLLHFIEDQMKEKNITREDVSFVLRENDPWVTPKDDEEDGSVSTAAAAGPQGTRTYIYNKRVIKQDVTCMNGYFNVIDGVLVTPPNMAEVIRENEDTKLFSSMLDRFSAPYYNEALTQRYRQSHDIGNDSVFEKRYLSSKSAGGAISRDPDGKGLGDFPLLAYDPGWNEYAVSSTVQKEYDMAAMFVPNDDAMLEYFTKAGGRMFMERYAGIPTQEIENITKEDLLKYLYKVPLDIIQVLINNLMKDSFNETVPSKYYMITNDAQDRMFGESQYPKVEDYKKVITKSLLANNGVVYVMDRVISPADFASVMGPSIYSKNTQIVKSIVRADDSYIGDNYNQAPLQKYYSTYLKAMQSRFSFFVPVDEGLGTYGYVDPMSLASKIPTYYKYWRWEYRPTQDAIVPVRAVAYRYNLDKGQSELDNQAGEGIPGGRLSEPNQSLNDKSGRVKRTLFLDMIDQHIVVHDKDNGGKEGISGDRKYYTARSGAPVIVIKGEQGKNGVGMEVNGGFQWELKRDASEMNDFDCKVIEGHDMTADNNGGYGNGMTYFLDRPMQPAMKSVYNVLSSDRDHYATFFGLCNASFAEEDLILAGFKEEIDNSNVKDKVQAWKNEQRKYLVLTNDGFNPASGEKIVRFLNNYRYTVYVPSNDAMNIAFENGLMTHDEIHEWIQDHKGEDGKLSANDKVKAKAMITMLVNFMKYHFQDQAFYVDKVEKAEAPYQTSCTDYSEEGNLNYVNITMRQANDKIFVTDRTGLTQEVVEPYNVLARDVNYDAIVNNPNSYPTINSSSYVVLHQVNNPLTFVDRSKWEEYGGRYDGAWANPSDAKAFLAKYRIVK